MKKYKELKLNESIENLSTFIFNNLPSIITLANKKDFNDMNMYLEKFNIKIGELLAKEITKTFNIYLSKTAKRLDLSDNEFDEFHYELTQSFGSNFLKGFEKNWYSPFL